MIHCVRNSLWSAVLLVGLACAGGASAQTFPSKPVRVIVGYGPGSGVDVITRLVTDGLSKEWGQPVVIETAGCIGRRRGDRS